MASSLKIIRQEHRNLASLLSCFKGVVRDKIADCRHEGLTQLPALRGAAERYCTLEFRHMGQEEAEILSRAQTHLIPGLGITPRREY